MRDGCDDEHGREREDHEATPIQERRVLVGAPEQQQHHGQPERPEHVEVAYRPPRRHARAAGSARPSRAPPRRGARTPACRCRSRRGRGRRRGVEHGHLDRRRGSDEQGQPGEPRPDAARRRAVLAHEVHAEQQQERPDDVELLLHRERPEVVERRGRAEAARSTRRRGGSATSCSRRGRPPRGALMKFDGGAADDRDDPGGRRRA